MRWCGSLPFQLRFPGFRCRQEPVAHLAGLAVEDADQVSLRAALCPADLIPEPAGGRGGEQCCGGCDESDFHGERSAFHCKWMNKAASGPISATNTTTMAINRAMESSRAAWVFLVEDGKSRRRDILGNAKRRLSLPCP